MEDCEYRGYMISSGYYLSEMGKIIYGVFRGRKVKSLVLDIEFEMVI